MKLIILDRDGVINQNSEHYIKSPDEWHPLPSSLEAIAHLKKLNYQIAIATNQSGIGRGYYTHEDLAAIHRKMQHLLTKHFNVTIDAIFYCPHHPNDCCTCRKPKIGLLQQIQHHFRTTLNGCPFVGDSPCDIEAATTAGCQPILVKTGNGEETAHHYQAITHYTDLATFVSTCQ